MATPAPTANGARKNEPAMAISPTPKNTVAPSQIQRQTSGLPESTAAPRSPRPAPAGYRAGAGAAGHPTVDRPVRPARLVPFSLVTTADLRLLSVHAHPDDEASKGAGTVARYVAEGVHATSCAARAARPARS